MVVFSDRNEFQSEITRKLRVEKSDNDLIILREAAFEGIIVKILAGNLTRRFERRGGPFRFARIHSRSYTYAREKDSRRRNWHERRG